MIIEGLLKYSIFIHKIFIYEKPIITFYMKKIENFNEY